MSSSTTTLRGFASSCRTALTSKGNGGGRGGTPHGPLNAIHRFLVKVEGAHTASEMATHLQGAGWWSTNAESPESTLCVQPNADFKDKGDSSITDPYDPLKGSIITKPDRGLFALRKGSPPPMPVEADEPVAEWYVAYLVAGFFENLLNIDVSKMSIKQAVEVILSSLPTATNGDKTYYGEILAALRVRGHIDVERVKKESKRVATL